MSAMGHTQVVPEEATASNRQPDDVKEGNANAQYIKILSCALAVVAAICVIIIALLSWHIANTDQEITQLKTDIDKPVTADERQSTTGTTYDRNTARPPITFDEVFTIINQTDVKSFLLQEVREELRDEISIIDKRVTQLESIPGFVAEFEILDGATIGIGSSLLTPKGSFYNDSNNAFTAPSDGIYFFTLKCPCVFNPTELNMHLMKNKKIIAEVKGVQNNASSTCVAEYVTGVLKLNKGDIVEANMDKFTGTIFSDNGFFTGKRLLPINMIKPE